MSLIAMVLSKVSVHFATSLFEGISIFLSLNDVISISVLILLL